MSVVRIDGLNAMNRALSKFGKDANAELRDESQRIADNIMVPAFKTAAMSVEHWGSALADGIRSKRDRVPAVNIGYQRAAVSGGASTNMLRYPSASGDGGHSFAPFVRTDWVKEATGYKRDAMDAWSEALDRVVDKWNRGID